MFARYSIQFWLLCLSTFLFFFSFTVLIPELPDYVTSLGGENYKGATIGLFTIAAGLSRPFSGKLADSIGRIPVMIFGGVVCIVMALLYPIFTYVLGFLVLRFFHGMSTGFMPTGTVAYLADLIPSDRRGEAMGLVGVMNNLGMMGGYAASSFITDILGINKLFWFSGIVALFSVLIIIGMKESLPNPQKLSARLFNISWDDIWDKRAKEPAIVMMLTVMMFGTIITLIPDYTQGLGLANKGIFVSIMTVSTIIVRLSFSKMSDAKGRVHSCKLGTMFWLIGALLLTFRNQEMFYLSAVVCGFASGINSPALFAWAVDVAQGEKSGRAMATLFIALELGITIGAFLSAAIYSNIFSNFSYVFIVMMVVCVVTLVYLFFGIENNMKNGIYNETKS